MERVLKWDKIKIPHRECAPEETRYFHLPLRGEDAVCRFWSGDDVPQPDAVGSLGVSGQDGKSRQYCNAHQPRFGQQA